LVTATEVMEARQSAEKLGPRSLRDVGCCVLLFVIVGALFLLFPNNFIGTSLGLAVPYAVVVTGMVVQIGHGRQLALSQVVFMALGAYGVAILNVNMGIPVGLATVVVVIASVAVSSVVGIVIARVGGLAIGLVTLFLVVMLANSIIYSSYLGGTTGMGPVAPLLSGSSAQSTQVESGLVATAVLAVVTLLVVRILRDDVGAEINLLGASNRAASSLGIRAGRRRVEIFVLGSALAALGGALFAGLQGFVSPTEFDPSAELTLLLMLFLGGQASIYCAVVGPFLIEALPGVSSSVANNITLIEGLLFTALLTLLPMGIGGLWRPAVDLVRHGSSARVERRAARASAHDRRGWIVGNVATAVGGRRARVPASSLATASELGFRTAGPGRVMSEAKEPAGPVQAVTILTHTAEQDEPEFVAEPVAAAHTDDSLTAGATVSPTVLGAREVTKTFGGVAAVSDVTIAIGGPGVYCIVGPNGAGKSTLLELLSGGHAPDGGTVEFLGRDVTSMPAWRRARLGMSRTFQNVELCDTLSPLDNVAVAAIPKHRGILRPVFKSVIGEARRQALRTMELFDVGDVAYLPMHRLTLAQERNLELSRALVGEPQVVLLDEPASGLSEQQRVLFADVLTRISRQLPVVLVEHDLNLVAKVAKVVTVLVNGQILYEGDVEGFENDPGVRQHLRGVS
jgi:branched-chain amino acid transport system permease protein